MGTEMRKVEGKPEVKQSKGERVVYFGIADCHGLESFVPEAEAKEGKVNLFHLFIRAQANRQRHAVMYRAELPKAEAEVIHKLLYQKGEFVTALQTLKAAGIIFLPSEIGWQKSWGMIPDSRLDPWRND